MIAVTNPNLRIHYAWHANTQLSKHCSASTWSTFSRLNGK